jgi:predicted Zn-dependent peptidase
MLLDAVLGKPRGLSFEHHSDDLTEGLEVAPAGLLRPVVDKGPAGSLGTAFVPMVYPGHYSIYATPKAGRSLADLEKAINTALRGAREVSVVSVDDARRLILAADSVETDSPLEAAHEMAFWTALGGANARRAVIEALAEVTAGEVQALARRLTPERAAIGWLLPPEGLGKALAPAEAETRPPGSSLSDRGACGLGAWPDEVKPATVAQVATARFPLDSGAGLVDSRPGLATFALRVAIPAPAGAQGSFVDRLRGIAQAMAEDTRAAALADMAGIGMSIVAPGDGRSDESDTLQIELTGPAARLGTAHLVLEMALPNALSAPPKTASVPERPDDIALWGLKQRLAEKTDGLPPPEPTIKNVAPGRMAIAPPTAPPVFFTLVGPVEKEAILPRWSDLAKCISHALAPQAATRAPAIPPGATTPPASIPAAAPEVPFKPGAVNLAAPGVVQGRLLIAIPGDFDPIVQDAVAWLLHHNYSGRLGAAAIAESGLVYEMESESNRRGAPFVWFSMGADPSQLVPLTRVLNSVIDTIVRDGFFTDAEVASYRSYAAGRTAVRLAHPDQAARFWTSVLLRGGDEKTPALEAARAAALSGEEVREAARRMLAESGRLTLTVGRRDR